MTRRRHFPLAAIILLSVLLRVGLALYLGNDLSDWRGGTADQVSYDALAQRVVGGHGFSFGEPWWPYAQPDRPTAFWSYLYTSYLAGIYALFGHAPLVARLVQAVGLGLAIPGLTYRIAAHLFDRRAAYLAAGIAAVYPYFLIYSAALMTEGPYIAAILWLLDVTLRIDRQAQTASQMAAGDRSRKIVRLGIELGLAVAATLLLRQVIVLFLVTGYALWWLWRLAASPDRRALFSTGLVAVAVTALLLAPWLVRNYRLFGQVGLPNTNAGFAFFWANHPIYGTRFEAVLSPRHGVSYQELIPVELRHLNEVALDRALMQRGLQEVRADPARYLLLSLSRVPVYFQFWPTADSSLISNAARLFSFGLFLPFMVYGLFRSGRLAWQKRSAGVPFHGPGALLLVLFAMIYTAVHLLSWANVRYRLPVDAVLILFAAYGLDDLWRRVRSRTGVVQ